MDFEPARTPPDSITDHPPDGVAETAPPPPETIAALPPLRTAGDLWLETLVVLLLAVVPYLFVSLASVAFPQLADQGSFLFMCCNMFVHATQVCAPVLYLMWRSAEPLAGFGLTRPRLFADIAVGVVIYFVGVIAWRFAYPVFASMAGGDVPTDVAAKLFEAPRSLPLHYLLLVLASGANAFSEELVMRAYLIPRFERLLGSTWLSLAVTTFLFAAYHLYQGAVGVFGAAVLGLVYGVSFCYFRRLWPLVIAHALQDVVALLQIAG